MTANDVYTIALSFLSENTMETNDVQQFTLGWLNLLLQESLPYENAYRQVNGMQPLKQAPQLAAFNDEIPYNDNITRIALPYGLASYYFIDDDNDYRAQDFRGRYINALSETCPYAQSDIQDIYQEDESEAVENA